MSRDGSSRRTRTQPVLGGMPQGRPWEDVEAELTLPSSSAEEEAQVAAIGQLMAELASFNQSVADFLLRKAAINYEGASVVFGARSWRRYFRRDRTYEWKLAGSTPDQQLILLLVCSDGAWRVTTPQGSVKVTVGNLQLASGVTADDLRFAKQLLCES